MILLLWHEIRKLVNLRSILITTLAVIIPAIAISCGLQSKTTPQVADTDHAAAYARLNDFQTYLTRLEQNGQYVAARNSNKTQLRAKWIEFGGMNDGENVTDGAYFLLVEAERTNPTQITNAFTAAHGAFRNFYDNYYTHIMFPASTLFITDKLYAEFTTGIEKFNTIFTPDPSTLSPTDIISARHEMSQIRDKTHFRGIIDTTHDKFITHTQAVDLATLYTHKKEKYDSFIIGGHIGAVTPERAVSFCDTAREYLDTATDTAVKINADFNVDKFYGISAYEKEQSKRRAAVLSYLFENDKFEIDFASSPVAKTSLAKKSIMDRVAGTTKTDFIYGAMNAALPVMLILCALLSIFSVFVDIKSNVILMTISSRFSRRKIVWMKILAMSIVSLLLLSAFLVAFSVIAPMVTTATTSKQIITIWFSKSVILMSPSAFIALFLLGTFIKFAAIIAFVSFVGVAIRKKYVAPILSAALLLAFLVLDLALAPFATYLTLLYPALAIVTAVSLVLCDRAFAKKEFLKMI
jgi:hypothetical protein